MTESFWDIMASHDPPVIEQCRQWLREVQDSRARGNLDRRLQGNADDYRSARMELLLHHVFHERGYIIAWEPALLGTKRVTEFRARSGDTTILVEAKASGTERAVQEHLDVIEPLLERFEGLHLPSVLSFEFVGTPPPLHKLEEVWSWAREAVLRAESRRESGASCHDEVQMKLDASGFVFSFSLFPPPRGDHSHEQGLVIPKTPLLKLDPGRKLYYDILEKATRYGELSEPFMIAVWGGHAGEEGAELAALYGTEQWTLTQETICETRLHDAIFTTPTHGGGHRYTHLSAVAFIRSSSTGGAVEDSLVVYHNPFAALPLDSTILQDFPQFTSDGNHMRWSSCQPSAE